MILFIAPQLFVLTYAHFPAIMMLLKRQIRIQDFWTICANLNYHNAGSVNSEKVTRYEPEFGWPLTISLWIIIILQGIAIAIFLFSGKAIGILFVIGIGIREVAAIGILLGKRWAFNLFCFVSVAPALMSLINNGFRDPVTLLLFILPAILIFYFGYIHWDQFD